MWHWHGDGIGGWGAGDWWSMALMMLLVWTPILIVGFLLLRAPIGPREPGRDGGDPAVEEARRAYARGDIDRERFQEVMRDLREHPAPPR